MKIIYPYLKNYSRELEWSIKSLVNTEHDGAIVIGDRPDYEVDAKFIKPDNPPLWARMSPYNDVVNKLLVASRLDIGDDFVFMNDDFFLMKPWDGTIYDRGTIADHVARRRTDTYTQMLERTKSWLEKNNYQTKSFDTHTPMIFNRKNLEELILRILPDIQYGGSMSIRTLYGNVYDVASEKMSVDTKNPTDYHGSAILSTNEETFNGEIGVYIRKALKKEEYEN